MKYIRLYESMEIISVFPSEEFGNAIGMEGLYEDYIFPKGYDYHKLFNMLRTAGNNSAKLKRIERIYYKIVKLNEELEAIPVYSFGDIWTILHGVCSKFLIQDIIFFNNLDRMDLLMYNQKTVPYKNWINEKTGHWMQWVACPETLNSILKFVK